MIEANYYMNQNMQKNCGLNRMLPSFIQDTLILATKYKLNFHQVYKGGESKGITM